MKHSLKSLFLTLIHQERGSMIIILAFSIPVLLAATGLAIDFSRYLTVEGQVQNAVDHAALAAVSVDGQDREEIVQRFFDMNFPSELREQIELVSFEIIEDFPVGGPLTLRVEATVTIHNAMGAFIGADETTFTTISEAMRQIENVEAVVTMASSGTMCSNKIRTEDVDDKVDGDILLSLSPDPSCTHFNAMRDGVREFLDIMESNEAINSLKIGIVPFNHKVRMPNLGSIPPSLAANEPAGFYSTMGSAEPISPVLPLTSNIASARFLVDNMTLSPAALGWSRTNPATHVASLMLDPEHSGYFDGIEPPEALGSPNTKKVVIMMTDGANIGCCFTNWPYGNFDHQYVYFHKPDNDQQLAQCEALKAQGVTIFSIIFDVSETDPGGQEINNVFARCASGAYGDTEAAQNNDAMLTCREKQYCFNVSDDEALKKAYRDIAQTFYLPRLSQ